MPEQLVDTGFPGQLFPVGSVATFLDHERRALFGTVTDLRHHEAILASGEAGRWGRVLRRAPAHQSRCHGRSNDAVGRRPRWATARAPPPHDAPATSWRFRFETRHVPRRHLPPARDRARDRRTRPLARRRVPDSRPHIDLHGEALQQRHAQPEAIGPPVPRSMVPSTPHETTPPTLDPSAVLLAHRLEAPVRPQGTCARKVSTAGGGHLASAAPDARGFEQVLESRLAEVGVASRTGLDRG
ncbi:MAG: hypothetical protein OXH52_02315 [Gammaproteobacteria bacterium]|nr:hypothetical protein [Gammaproteobacteria bacterium]